MDHRSLEKLEYDQIRRMVADRCRCALGIELASRMDPSSDFERVKSWQASTTAMVQAILDSGLPPFGGITDVTESLNRIRPGGGPEAEDFKLLSTTLAGAAAVGRWFELLDGDVEAIAHFRHRIGDFTPVIEAIDRVIDDRGEIRDSASERLRTIRRDLEALRGEVRSVAYEYLRRPEVANCLQSPTVQMYEDRFVLPLKAEHRGRVRGVIHRTSGSGATLFIEPEACMQLNNRIVTLLDKQHDEIRRLLNELAIKVHTRDAEVRQLLKTLAVIDLLTAKAQLSSEMEMTPPQLSEDGPVRLRDVRHPLLLDNFLQYRRLSPADQEKVEDAPHEVVPIDLRLGDDFNILVITGSNTGGKTVAMKTLGLIAAMAQSGLHIPAAYGAQLPVFKDILLDVGDEQSLQQSLSTFGGHLKRINRIIRRSQAGTLVLLDELGSGTDPDEGGAIGQSVMDELLRRGAMAIITTHLGVLKAYAFNHDEVDNACVEFDVETLRPTYKLLIGEPGESHAIVIAERYGLPKRIIRRARHHLPRTGAQLKAAIAATKHSRRASEQAMRQADMATSQAHSVKSQYDEKLAELKATRQQFSEWLASLQTLKSGDEIFVRCFKRTAKLVRLHLSRQVVVVDLNGLEAEVSLQEIMPEMGDSAAANEIFSLRQRLRDADKLAQRQLELAEQAKKQAEDELNRMRQRQQYVNDWLTLISVLKIGDKVEFEPAPHHGEVTALDLPNGKVTLNCEGDKQLELPVQQLFPHTGAFTGKRRAAKHNAPRSKDPKDRPIRHRNPAGRKTRLDMKKVANLEAGDKVYLTIFRQNASVIKIDKDRNSALVHTGAFEIEVQLSDLAPIGQNRGSGDGDSRNKSSGTAQN